MTKPPAINLPLELNRRKFLKGIGLMGAAIGGLVADELKLYPNHKLEVLQTEPVPTSSTEPLQDQKDVLKPYWEKRLSTPSTPWAELI
jgi:hypothetical protein